VFVRIYPVQAYTLQYSCCTKSLDDAFAGIAMPHKWIINPLACFLSMINRYMLLHYELISNASPATDDCVTLLSVASSETDKTRLISNKIIKSSSTRPIA
jgi:hypothetical protein